MQSQATTYRLIENIEHLRLDKFIDCMCDQKLEVLVLSGEPSPADLLECWSNLYAQYLDILDDAETLYLLHLQRDIALMENKIVMADAILKVLEFFHVEQLVQDLRSLGFSTVGLKQGHSGYQHTLKKIDAKLAHLGLQLQAKQDELRNYHKDKQSDIVSRQFFARQLSRLSKYQGYPINRKTTMVPDYVAILKDYLSQSTKKTKDDGEER